MIIIVCTDDDSLVRIARNASRSNYRIFGAHYQVFEAPIPQLLPNEDLFIIAHGAYQGDDGNPVIGDKQNALYLNARVLYHNIVPILPADYSADIYIDACESADRDPETLSFCEGFKDRLAAAGIDVRVFGKNGASSGELATPDAPGWVEAYSD